MLVWRALGCYDQRHQSDQRHQRTHVMRGRFGTQIRLIARIFTDCREYLQRGGPSKADQFDQSDQCPIGVGG